MLFDVKEATGGGVHVGHGVVGSGEFLARTDFIELGQGRPFEFFPSGICVGNFSPIDGLVLGAKGPAVGYGIWLAEPDKFGSQNRGVKIIVVADHCIRVLEVGEEIIQNGIYRHPFFYGLFGGNPVNHSARNLEAVRLYNMVSLGLYFAVFICQQPSELNDSGPVVDVVNGGFVFTGKPRGLGVEDEVLHLEGVF